MSFNFSNIRNSTLSVSNSHLFTPSFGPNPSLFTPLSGTNPSPFTPLPGSNSSPFTPSPHSLYPPAGTSHPLSHGCDSNVDPNLDSEAVSACFIDILANQFSFGDQEQDLQHNLHGFAKMGQGLSKADIATQSYLLAAIFSLIKENWEMTNAQHNTQQLLTAIYIYLLTDASHITFMTMHFDVEAKIQASQKDLKFSNIYGNPAHEQVLMAFIKHQCSSICNSFQEVLQDSIGGPTSGLAPAFNACLAILHCFSYENSELLDHLEEDADEELAQANDEETACSSMEPPKKRRQHGSHVLKGDDFWSQIEKWFNACWKCWGDSWSAPGWHV
ncbi:hypothetical protein V8B97DRAFT_2021243 [Scleroderma yunnanense]